MTKIKLLLTVVLMLLACGMFAAPANAYIVLNDWAFNIDGAPSEYSWGDPFPATGSLDGSGLGTITVTVDGPGTHYVGLFVDHEIDEATNTYFNENGATSGTPAVGPPSQSWEIDEPGYVFGDIYDNVLDGTLDNSNAVPAGSEDDVSMALAWDFVIPDLGFGGDEYADVVFTLSATAPDSGFYLEHNDPDSDESVYFSSTLAIVPVPGALLLAGIGSGLVGLLNRRRQRQ